MTRQEKVATIEELQNKFAQHEFFYVTDSSKLSVEQVNKLRRLCFENGIEMRVVKNTLTRKALEAAAEEKGYTPLYDVLKGPTAIMFTETSNAPAKTIKQFREDYDKPILKAAYIDSDVYVGDDQLDVLADLKSKEELIGEVIGLLQSPMQNLISALQSGGNTLTGLLKALEERGDAPAGAQSETTASEEAPAAESSPAEASDEGEAKAESTPAEASEEGEAKAESTPAEASEEGEPPADESADVEDNSEESEEASDDSEVSESDEDQADKE